MTVGLAVSNDHVATAMFQASHILAACESLPSTFPAMESAKLSSKYRRHVSK